MKNLVKPAAIAIAIALSAFTSAANASGGPHFWYSSLAAIAPAESNFSIEINKKESRDVISINIQNPKLKNLSVTLVDPDGNTIDNFHTGRKFASVSRDYNFTGAEPGNYSLIISDGVEKIKRQITFERFAPTPVSKLEIQKP